MAQAMPTARAYELLAPHCCHSSIVMVAAGRSWSLVGGVVVCYVLARGISSSLAARALGQVTTRALCMGVARASTTAL